MKNRPQRSVPLLAINGFRTADATYQQINLNVP